MLMGRDRDGDGRQKQGTGNCADISWVLRNHNEIKHQNVYFSHPHTVERKDTHPHSRKKREESFLLFLGDSSRVW